VTSAVPETLLGPQKHKIGHMTLIIHLSGVIYRLELLELAMVNLSTKFEVSISKIADLNLPLLYLAPIRVTPFEFQKDL